MGQMEDKAMPSVSIPLPPLELRRMVGPIDQISFDNPSGEPIYARYDLPLDAYESVFDFGCGCGRVARQLLAQRPRPHRYVGIDIHRDMVDWCRASLSLVDPNFQFFHHDVYSPLYAPGNSLRLAEPFPVQGGEVSLLIADSIFTHLCRQQTEYYLHEAARVLSPQGIAFTSWLFFDRDSFPFLGKGPFCLYTSEADFGQAVIYDRKWFLDAVRQYGLSVRSTVPPSVAGHQWMVFLQKRAADPVDQFPLGEDAAEWLCGATLKPIAARPWTPEPTGQGINPAVEKSISSNSQAKLEPPRPPALFGALAELEAMKRSWTWRIGRAATAPARVLKRLVGF
jgi:SAM-dependent methyltransferase